MLPRTVELLRDVLREPEFLSAPAGQTTAESFLHDEVLKRAFARSLEIIGEATKKVPKETRRQHITVEWKKMAGMRDRLIHDYGGVDFAAPLNTDGSAGLTPR